MSYELRTSDPRSDATLAPLLDAAFQRPGRESRLVQQLAQGFPTFDPGLSLVAVDGGVDVGYALFLPRRFRLRGCEVPLVISSPFCTLPDSRGRAAGTFLLEVGLAALADRGIRGAVVLGGQEFFGRRGYVGAFNLYTIDARRGLLESVVAQRGLGDEAWRGLAAEDIPTLHGIYAQNYAGVCGSELRSDLPIDWESSADAAYTLVHERDGVAVAYLRFRVRETLTVMECGAADPAAVDALLAFVARLAAEHSRSSVEVHLPPAHPFFRELFRCGCMAEGNNFHDAALMRVVDWPGLLADTGASWGRALSLAGHEQISLGIEGSDHLLVATGEASIEVEPGRADLHLDLPAGTEVQLMTGRLDWRDLVFGSGELAQEQRPLLDTFGREFLSLLFPTRTPMWTYSPIFEIADE
jgi:predicted N-acetyltransferase YhbS